MEVLTKKELQLRRKEILTKIKKGSIFIHPTDTIYGLGCLALSSSAVEKIRLLKERQDKPLSIWVPSLEWVRKNCAVAPAAEKWLEKLPGPYTLLIPLKNKNAVAENVTLGSPIIGIRYPKHWFQEIVTELGEPIITTSANKTGEPFMTSLKNLDPEIEQEVEFIMYEGDKEAHPSKIVDVEKEEVKER